MSDDIQESLRLLQFTDKNAEDLRKISPFVEKDLPKVLTGFYSFLGEWENLRVMFRGQEGMDFAKNAQVKHWMKICEGNFDEAYAHSVRRIGLTHHRLNLEPKWYLGGYAYIMTRLIEDLLKDKGKRSFFGKSDEELPDLLNAFVKAVFLDITYAITVYLDEGRDEKARIVEKLSSDIERDIGGIVSKIVAEMKSLEKTAVELNEISGATSRISGDVAAAAEEASTNVNAVAAATEEISNSVQEVRKTVERSFEMTQEAVTQVDNVGQSVTDLVKAIGNIANVSSVIGDIAAQTNLLALNATIEAARAGEAGKGFAVVANEVKTLANMTAESTKQISTEIEQIQALATKATATIETVVRTIRQISDYAIGMNNGMQEQAQASAEIARNVDEAATGTADVTRNITDVSQMNHKTEAVSGEVLSSARNMATQADELEKTLRIFLSNLKKA